MSRAPTERIHILDIWFATKPATPNGVRPLYRQYHPSFNIFLEPIFISGFSPVLAPGLRFDNLLKIIKSAIT